MRQYILKYRKIGGTSKPELTDWLYGILNSKDVKPVNLFIIGAKEMENGLGHPMSVKATRDKLMERIGAEDFMYISSGIKVFGTELVLGYDFENNSVQISTTKPILFGLSQIEKALGIEKASIEGLIKQ